MRRVLFISNIPSPYRMDYFNSLGNLCELTVCFERDSAKNRENSWLSNGAKTFKKIILSGFKIGDDQALCLGVIEIIKNGHFDVVILGVYSSPTSIVAIEYLRHKNIPCVFSFDGAFLYPESSIKASLKRHLLQGALAYLSPGIKCDEYIKNYCSNSARIIRYPFTSLNVADILAMPKNADEKRKIRKELGVTEDVVVLSVGQFIHRKGMDTLIHATKNFCGNVGVLIVGGVPTEEYHVLISNESITNVHFVGFKSKDELRKYYSAADVFVLATREDIWGLVINEAMAYGLPVITTDRCQAGLELVRDGYNGYIVKPEETEQLSSVVNELIINPDMRCIFGARSLEIIREYTIERMARSNMSSIDELLEGGESICE